MTNVEDKGLIWSVYKKLSEHKKFDNVNHQFYFYIDRDHLLIKYSLFNFLSFIVNDRKLILLTEHWISGGRPQYSEYGHNLGEPDVDHIIALYNIFCEEGKVKYPHSEISLVDLLNNHIKCHHTKSARI